MISYVVPCLDEFGGMQDTANLVYSHLRSQGEIQLINWKHTNWSLITKVFGYSTFLNIDFAKFFPLNSDFKEAKNRVMNSDLIHFWHLGPARGFIKRNYIVSCHGVEILEPNLKILQKEAYPKVLRNAKVVHVNSNYTKRLLSRFRIPDTKVKIINPPIDYEKFASHSQLENRIEDKVVIGTLSRFISRKNVPNIIKALQILRNHLGVDFKYYLAGDGYERERILAELKGVSFQFEYFGSISDETKVTEFYPALDVFVMPPLDLPNDVEGFGVVYLEANAYGIPVVASRVGGVPDAVKEGASGVFADPTNPHDIAIKILELLENKESYDHSARAWAEQFDIKRVAKRFIEMYDEASS